MDSCFLSASWDFPWHSSQKVAEFLCPSSVFQSSPDDLGFFNTTVITSLFLLGKCTEHNKNDQISLLEI